ncbi:MAG TPA: ABC transporter permease [Gammaproteobacteria bacterium]|nr:ABC transporter permease [Gammaproteobacteria bacterium]
MGDQFAPLSSNYLLGADENGRDILSRLIFGSRTSLLGPLAVILIALIVGVPLAIASAWKGGLSDVIIGRILDLIFCFPPVLTAALIVTLLNHRGLAPAVVAVGIAYIPWTARITRSAALRERFLPYITACEVQGFSVFSICTRHMLPNLSRLIVAQSTIAFGHALVDIAALSFLGLAIQSPNPDWGLMVGSTGSIARGEYGQAIFAGILIIITVAAFSIIGNRISENESN